MQPTGQRRSSVWGFAFILIVAASLAPACSDDTNITQEQTHPVRWTEQFALDSLERLDAHLYDTVDMGDNTGPLYLTNPDNEDQRIAVTTGRQYFDLKRKGFYPYTTYDITIESWFKAACEPLLYLKKAKPARVSYIADFKLNVNPLSVLPPSLGPIISGDEERRVEQGVAQGKTWADLFPGTVVESAGPTDVRLKDDNTLITLSLIAWGDFNGDGFEDVLVYRTFNVIKGTLRSYRHVVLTRCNSKDRLTVVPIDIYNAETPHTSDDNNQAQTSD